MVNVYDKTRKDEVVASYVRQSLEAHKAHF